jgi:crossover junction endodeoxyribonuclease RuvC
LKILGIDPGLGTTGYGIVDQSGQRLNVVTFGGIDKSPRASFTENLLTIYQTINQIIIDYQPDACAIENIFYHQNKKTAIIMGHVRGVAMVAAAEKSLPVYEYSPKEVKQSIVGMGGASKSQVQAMVKNILKMAEVPQPEDAADALAVAICHYHRLKFEAILSSKTSKSSSSR